MPRYYLFHNSQPVLNNFSHNGWIFVLFWEISVWILYSYLNQGIFLQLCCLNSLDSLVIISYQTHGLKVFSLILSVTLLSVDCFLCWTDAFSFDVIPFVYIYYYCLCFGVIAIKSLPDQYCRDFPFGSLRVELQVF